MSNNQNQTKKPVKHTKLWILLVVVILLLVGLYFKYYDSIKSKYYTYGGKSVVISHENLQDSLSLEEIKKELNSNQKAYQNIEQSINELRSVLSNRANTEQIKFVIYGIKLQELLRSSNAYTAQIDIFNTLTKNVALRKSLEDILPYAGTGVATNEQISDDFSSKIYKEIYLYHFKNQHNLRSQLWYFLNKLIFFKNINNDSLEQTDIAYKLNLIQINLNANDLQAASALFDEFKGINSSAIQKWKNSLEERIKVNVAIDLIDKEISAYISER
jgi:hypothetical protein